MVSSGRPLYGTWPELDAAFAALTGLPIRFLASFGNENNELIVQIRTCAAQRRQYIKMAETRCAVG
jgi:hypothetical protein